MQEGLQRGWRLCAVALEDVLVCFSAVNELLLHAGVDCSISLDKPHWEEVGYTIFSGVCVCVCVCTAVIYNPGYNACNTVLVPNS